MSQVSEIVVRWTPETSGRVASIQIQSRIAGQPEWTEQSAAFDPTVGEFRFTANAPSTNVEVRARYRMIDGLFGPWLGDNIITASAVVEYDTITGTPTTIHDINPGEGTKLDGIEPGATNGAVIGGNVKNPDGTLYVPVTTDYEDIRHEVEQDITSALNTAKAGLDADIQSVRNDVSAARGEITQAKTDLQTGITGAATAAQQARDDLASEVTRAKNEEGAIRTTVASVKQTADKATTDISDEITARTNATSALGNRTSTVEAQLRGDQDSGLAAKVRDEASARVNADDALSGRVSTTEAKLNGSQDSAIAAAVRDEATARTNADGALGTRLQTIEADYVTNGGAGSIAQAKVNDEATARSNADSALSTRAGTLEAQMRGEQDSTLAARIRDEATARSDAVSAVAGRTSTLETASFGAGNLLSNTDFGTLDGWTITNNPNGVMQLQLNGAGDGWHPVGENALTIYQPGRLGGNYGEAQSSPFAVTEGEWLQFYAFTASHRSRAWTTLFFMDSAGNNRGYAGENFGARTDAGGQALTAFDQTGLKACQVPAGATQARFAVRKYDTVEGQGDSWGWFVRPYVGRARQGQTEWNPYSPGSAKVTVAATNTKIGDEATARSNADSALSGRVSTTEAKLNGDQDSTLAARIRDEATARADAVSAVAGRTSTLETRSAQTPVSFIARAYGNGDGQSPFGHTSGVANASGTMIGVNGRSYGVYVFNSANTLIAANSYDVYGTGGQPEAMAAFLNGITNGQAVIITTADEPANNRLNGGLVAAMERCGAGDLFYTAARPSDFKYHSAYVLIGRAGIGRGNGQEFYKGDYDTAPNSWLEVRFDLLNGVPVLGGAGAQFLTNAKISDEATARSNADSAISNRVSTTEAQMRGDQDSTLAARIRDEATARTNADGALATRATNLEVSATASNANTLNQNPSFAYWTDPNGLPNGWGWWIAQGTVTRNQTDNSSGGYAFRHNIPAGYEGGIMQGACRLNAGWYVMEADIELLDGNMTGAGLTVEGVFNLDFAREPDVNGEVGSGGFRRRRFTKLFYCDRPLNNWHAMTNWGSFAPLNYKYMDWHYCGVRPATAGEILAQKVDNDVNGAGGAIARIGAEETARANGDSAIAGRTSTLEAVANRNGYLNRNATFAEPWNGTGLPPAWGIWQQEGGGFYGAWSGTGTNYGSKAFQWDRNGTNSGFFQAVYGQFAKGWYVLEAEIRLEDGNTYGSGLHANFMNGYSGEVNFSTEPDTHEYTGNRGNGNYHFTKLIFNGDNASQINLHPMAGWSSLAGWSGFLRTIWFKAGIRPATTSEIKSGKVDGIGARLTTVESTTATVNGKTQAYFSKSVSVPGAQAFITAQALNDAGQATSDVAIGGNSIALYNTADGTARRAMYLAAGNATFDGFITARSGIRIGDGQWSIAVSPKDFSVSNGTYVSYGYDLGRVPTVTFGPAPIALNAGEVYRAYAANSTSTGFTAVCEIVSAPTSSNQSVGPGYSVNGAQAFEVGKGTADATNGVYNFSVSGTVQAYAYSDGGGINCVHVDAWLTDMLQAGDAQVGDEIMVLTEHRETWEPARVERSYVAESHCVRITTVSGIKLTLSEDTPVTLQDGREIWVREIVGEEVAVLDHGAFRWEEVIGLEEIGQQPVARLSVWSGTYAAGDEKGRMIFTHNLPNKP